MTKGESTLNAEQTANKPDSRHLDLKATGITEWPGSLHELSDLRDSITRHRETYRADWIDRWAAKTYLYTYIVPSQFITVGVDDSSRCRYIHSPSQFAWSEGWQPSWQHSTLNRWTKWTFTIHLSWRKHYTHTHCYENYHVQSRQDSTIRSQTAGDRRNQGRTWEKQPGTLLDSW